MTENCLIMCYNFLFPLILVSLLAFSAWAIDKIDSIGAVTGALVSFVLILGIGWLGLLLIGSFFVLGTLASWWKLEKKEAMGLAEKRRGKRGVANVLANALIPTICAGIAMVFPAEKAWMEILAAVGFASATSDTLSSEMGNVYGKKYVNIITLEEDRKGSDGVVSLEGCLFGLMGSGFIGLMYYLFTKETCYAVLVIIMGFAGNLLDSLLGATLQQKGYINNHTVNFLNTIGACLLAFIALLIYA